MPKETKREQGHTGDRNEPPLLAGDDDAPGRGLRLLRLSESEKRPVEGRVKDSR